MKRFLVLAFITTIVATSCGSLGVLGGPSIKVGLVTDIGQLNDRGFNHLSYTGLTRAEKQLGIQGRIHEAASGQDYIPNMTSFARQGYDLLEKKREILVIELLKRMDELNLLEREIQALTEKAYLHLRETLLVVGRERALAISSQPLRSITLKTMSVTVSGMSLSTLAVQAGPPELNYSFLNSFAVCDETMIEFSELLQKLAAAAGLRSIVWRLAREVRKTQRRVNALDKMVIPRSGDIVKFIESTLDERERESLFVVKLLKQRIAGQDSL